VALAMALALAACGGGSNNGSDAAAHAPTTSSAGDGATSNGPTGTPVTIGVVGAYTGPVGEVSPSADAVRAWAAMTNAQGGINGHPINVIVKDDQGDATKAVAAVKELISQKVIAIVGPHESGLESSWQKLVDAAHIPVIGGNGTGAVWLSDPNFFPSAATAVNYLTSVTYTTVLAQKSKFAALYCAEAPACAQAGQVTQGAAGKLGLQYVGGLGISASAPNYTAQCATLRGKGAEVAFAATNIQTTVRLIGDCARQGYKPIWVDSPQNWDATQTKNSAWDGAWLASDSPLWVGDDPQMQAYVAAMKKYVPDSDYQNTASTASWTGAALFGAAIQKSGATGLPTSADIYKGLYALGADFTLDGSIPPVTFTEGKPAVQKPCAWYGQVSGGQVTLPKGTNPVCVGA